MAILRHQTRIKRPMTKTTLEEYLSRHYIHKSNWLRAAVLGANDGIISTSSLAIAVSSASSTRETILLSTIAGLTAGALSMAAGEYVSVSSQYDIEEADIAREKQEIEEGPEEELAMLAMIYERRGLKPETAKQVALELTHKDALGAHVRDELGINETSRANPTEAAWSSGLAFVAGGILPLLLALFAPLATLEYWLYCFTSIFLAILGMVTARASGTKKLKSVLRITILGTCAMALSALVGYVFGVSS